MIRRLLFVASEPPAIGGSSTASFALCRKLRADGVDVHFVTALEPDDAGAAAALLGAPPPSAEAAEGFTSCSLAGLAHEPDPGLAALVDRLDPTIVVGFGYRAALAAKSAAPSRRVILVTGTCKQAQHYVTSGRAADAIALASLLAADGPPPRLLDAVEARSVEACDLVVTHSPQTLAFMERFYPTWVGRIYPRVVSFAEWICEDAAQGLDAVRDFAARDIDVLFVASYWDRVEKNYPLVRAIAKALPGRSVHVVGACPSRDPGIVHDGFLSSRREIFALMGRARVLACPSLIDAAPGVLFEGSVLGCNLVATRNCGNWTLCHPALLAPTLDAGSFVTCIQRACERPYPDGRQTFLDAGCYAEWRDLLEAFAEPIPAQVAS